MSPSTDWNAPLNLLSPEAIRAAGEAMETEALARTGHDLGTIHRDAIAAAAVRAAVIHAHSEMLASRHA